MQEGTGSGPNGIPNGVTGIGTLTDTPVGFANPGAGDFQITGSSPAALAGVVTSVTPAGGAGVARTTPASDFIGRPLDLLTELGVFELPQSG